MLIDNELEQRELKEALENIALSEMDGLHWYEVEMIRLYVKLGNFRAIEKFTNIPFPSCYKTITAAFEKLKIKAREKAKSQAEERFLKKFCHRCKLKKPKRYFRLLNHNKKGKTYSYYLSICKSCEYKKLKEDGNISSKRAAYIDRNRAKVNALQRLAYKKRQALKRKTT